MKITFDPNKAAINFRKHGIKFSDAESVLFDPLALTREDIRLISARPATANEREYYES